MNPISTASARHVDLLSTPRSSPVHWKGLEVSPAQTFHRKGAANSVLVFSSRVRRASGAMTAAVATSGRVMLNAMVKSFGCSLAPQQGRGAFWANARLAFNCMKVVAQRYHSEEGYHSVQANSRQYEQIDQDRDQFPRPRMIPWEKDLANGVQLIGYIGRDLDIKYLDTGKIVAKSSLSVAKSSKKDEVPSWFELDFWDELAESAAHHVKKGDRIFVAGRIYVDKFSYNDTMYTKARVSVINFCFVERYGSQQTAYAQPGASEGGGSDNRFQQQGTQAEVEAPNSQSRPASAGSSDEDQAVEKRWQVFFADPSQWWDNRGRKKNPKGPDFKHKSTQEALWLNSWRNPPWVEAQLAAWEEKKAQTGGERNFSKSTLSSFRESDFL